jgi:hypothetical protein
VIQEIRIGREKIPKIIPSPVTSAHTDEIIENSFLK